MVNHKPDNVKNHPAAKTDDYTIQTPDFAARVHFIVTWQISIELCFIP